MKLQDLMPTREPKHYDGKTLVAIAVLSCLVTTALCQTTATVIDYLAGLLW